MNQPDGLTRNDAGTAVATPLVLPPYGLKLLDHLAWCIGRDDAARGLPALRCQNYRQGKAAMFMAGYDAQKRQNAELSEPGGPAASAFGNRVAPPGFAPVTGSGTARK